MNSVAFQRYAPSLLSFAVFILGVLQSVTAINLVVVLQVASLALGSALTLLVPLVDKKWQGAAKTGLELATTVIALVLPYAIAGVITREQIFIVVIGVIKAAATEFGVQIRTDPKLGGDALGTVEVVTPDTDLTSLPTSDPGTPDQSVVEGADYIEPPADVEKPIID